MLFFPGRYLVLFARGGFLLRTDGICHLRGQ